MRDETKVFRNNMKYHPRTTVHTRSAGAAAGASAAQRTTPHTGPGGRARGPRGRYLERSRQEVRTQEDPRPPRPERPYRVPHPPVDRTSLKPYYIQYSYIRDPIPTRRRGTLLYNVHPDTEYIPEKCVYE